MSRQHEPATQMTTRQAYKASIAGAMMANIALRKDADLWTPQAVAESIERQVDWLFATEKEVNPPNVSHAATHQHLGGKGDEA